MTESDSYIAEQAALPSGAAFILWSLGVDARIPFNAFLTLHVLLTCDYHLSPNLGPAGFFRLAGYFCACEGSTAPWIGFAGTRIRATLARLMCTVLRRLCVDVGMCDEPVIDA